MAKRTFRQRAKIEFRPDKQELTWVKSLYMTRQQRLKLLKWTLYTVICLLLLVIQDVVMSRFSIFGTTTDLAACVILLITILEGSETGSLFVLIASLLYFFSGSAPGAFCIASLSFLGIFTALLRQMYWRRNAASIILCAGAALMVHELVCFTAGMAMGFTIFSRLGLFAIKGLLSWLVMLPLYPLVYTIGKIGGQTWKE